MSEYVSTAAASMPRSRRQEGRLRLLLKRSATESEPEAGKTPTALLEELSDSIDDPHCVSPDTVGTHVISIFHLWRRGGV